MAAPSDHTSQSRPAELFLTVDGQEAVRQTKGNREGLHILSAVPLATLKSKMWPCHMGTRRLNL